MGNVNDNTMVMKVDDILSETLKPQSKACLIVVAGRMVGQILTLRKNKLILGRGVDCDLMIEDPGISRRHARLVCTSDGAVQIIDLDSTNGTFVNGRRIQAQSLSDGDKIQLGPGTIFKFSYQDQIDQQFQRRLYQNATQDGLTQLYNRKYFLDRLNTDFTHAIRHGRPLSAALIDVDYFKSINDTHGHLVGDEVLRKLAGVLLEATRDEDLVARWGGEEFAIIYRDADRARATICGERVRRMVEKSRFCTPEKTLPVTVSIGIATLDGNNLLDAEQLMRSADEYLYQAKRNGRNRVETALTHRPPPARTLSAGA
ncbi:MAG: GGDEF domain-containing protein [Phycisphaerales bacterium]|nr:GGDEF domain-containing protein [Phycisphaerales bacterium]